MKAQELVKPIFSVKNVTMDFKVAKKGFFAYDLSNYKGCEVVIYTYNINAPTGYSGECVINIIVYNNRVIGGDVSSVALGGFMLPIKNKSE